MPLGSRIPKPPLHKRTVRKVIPHKSGVHRLACLTLYKLLLRQIPSSPLPHTLLHTVLRTEFRHDARLRIHADIRQSLTTGYNALSLLHSLHNLPAGSETISSLNEHLLFLLQQQQQQQQSLPLSAKASAKVRAKAKAAEEEAASQKPPPPRLTTYPGGNKILDRPFPLSALSGGRRHVPQLINASGFPMLRVKKPQPPLIGKMIRDKIAQRQRRHLLLAELEEESLSWAMDEDAWDEMMRELVEKEQQQQHKRYGGGNMDGHAVAAIGDVGVGGGSYVRTVRERIQDVKLALTAELVKQAELAKRFWEIVLEEQALADKEREERRRAKLDAWLAKVRMGMEGRGLVWEDRSAATTSTTTAR